MAIFQEFRKLILYNARPVSLGGTVQSAHSTAQIFDFISFIKKQILARVCMIKWLVKY